MQANFLPKAKFSSRLSQAIEKDGRSKTAIAIAVGVKPPALSRWLSGVIPDHANLTKLAQTLGVDVQWFLADGESEPTSTFREEATPYKFTQRGPVPQPTQSAELHSGCQMMLNAIKHASTQQAFDFAVHSFEEAWAQFKEAKYDELNQTPP